MIETDRLVAADRGDHRDHREDAMDRAIDRAGSMSTLGNAQCGNKWRSSSRRRAAAGNRSTIP